MNEFFEILIFTFRWNTEAVDIKVQSNKINNIYESENGKSFEVTVNENVRITNQLHFQVNINKWIDIKYIIFYINTTQSKMI